jgi:hypothetical protein
MTPLKRATSGTATTATTGTVAPSGVASSVTTAVPRDNNDGPRGGDDISPISSPDLEATPFSSAGAVGGDPNADGNYFPHVAPSEAASIAPSCSRKRSRGESAGQ